MGPHQIQGDISFFLLCTSARKKYKAETKYGVIDFFELDFSIRLKVLYCQHCKINAPVCSACCVFFYWKLFNESRKFSYLIPYSGIDNATPHILF